MTKEDTRARLIAEGARLIHKKGYNHTGVLEILQASGVAKGSFYFYFQTKEEFGLAVVVYFSEFMVARMERHLSDASLTHIGRLKRFFDEMMNYFGHEGCSCGCPIGNLAQELADLNDTFRKTLKDVLDTMQGKIAGCLEAAQDAHEIASDLNPHEAASFILNSWEGALTRMKTEKNLEPLTVFDKMMFGRFLARPGEEDHCLGDPGGRRSPVQ